MRTHKTVPWRRARYKAHLDEADALRQEIADEAQLDLSKFNLDEYDDSVVASPPDERDFDLLAHEQVLERWESVAGRRVVWCQPDAGRSTGPFWSCFHSRLPRWAPCRALTVGFSGRACGCCAMNKR